MAKSLDSALLALLVSSSHQASTLENAHRRKVIEDSIKLLQPTAGRCAGEVASAKVNGVIRLRELSPSPLLG